MSKFTNKGARIASQPPQSPTNESILEQLYFHRKPMVVLNCTLCWTALFIKYQMKRNHTPLQNHEADPPPGLGPTSAAGPSLQVITFGIQKRSQKSNVEAMHQNLPRPKPKAPIGSNMAPQMTFGLLQDGSGTIFWPPCPHMTQRTPEDPKRHVFGITFPLFDCWPSPLGCQMGSRRVAETPLRHARINEKLPKMGYTKFASMACGNCFRT